MKQFSDRENKIIKILGRRKMTLEEISQELFVKDKPFDSCISIANSVRRIISKCSYHNFNWTLLKSREGNKLVIKRGKITIR